MVNIIILKNKIVINIIFLLKLIKKDYFFNN